MAETREEPLNPEDIHVKLKPVLGIRPGVYLTVLYAAVLILLLFLLLFYPGIRRNGSNVTFDSLPDGAAVYIDGAYAGETPCTVFVVRGDREIRMTRTGFDARTYTLAVSGRVFGSLIAKKRMTTSQRLELKEPTELLDRAFSELSAWALVSPYSATYRPEPVVSDALSAYGAVAGDPVALDVFFKAALLNVSGAELADDLLKGVVLGKSGTGIVTPQSILSVGRLLIELTTEYPNIVFLLAEFMDNGTPGSGARGLFDQPWFARMVEQYGTSLAAVKAPDRARLSRVALGGMQFVSVPAGSFGQGVSRSGVEHPHVRFTDGFLIKQTEVTQAEYARFIEARPYWSPRNLDALIADGVATDAYLSDWNPDSHGSYPVRFVSWYAAEAYAEWLNDSGDGRYQFRLPSETQWEYAATIAADDPESAFEARSDGPSPVTVFEASQSVPAGMLGSLWEWCDTWYLPAAYFFTSFDGGSLQDTLEIPSAAERVLKGGSWADSAIERIDAASRGSNPPSWCTPFAGFRVVAVEAG